jgi:hypothetical protein
LRARGWVGSECQIRSTRSRCPRPAPFQAVDRGCRGYRMFPQRAARANYLMLVATKWDTFPVFQSQREGNMRKSVLLLAAAFVLALWSVPASAQSCSSWGQTCKSRCAQSGVCPAGFCEGKVRACKKSGCFTEGINNKGARHCGLNKT